MRKHFLLLFLMALLPLAGWAADEITAAPEAVENLTYTSEGLNLVAAGEVAEGWTMQYAKSDDGTITGDDLAALGWNAAIPQGDVAGTYFVYYRAYKAESDPVYGTDPVEVTIAKKLATVKINATAFAAAAYHRVYGWKPADFAGDVITTAKAALTAGEDVFVGFASHDDETAAVNNIVINWGNNVNAKGYYNAGEHTFTLSFNSMPNRRDYCLYPCNLYWFCSW